MNLGWLSWITFAKLFKHLKRIEKFIPQGCHYLSATAYFCSRQFRWWMGSFDVFFLFSCFQMLIRRDLSDSALTGNRKMLPVRLTLKKKHLGRYPCMEGISQVVCHRHMGQTSLGFKAQKFVQMTREKMGYQNECFVKLTAGSAPSNFLSLSLQGHYSLSGQGTSGCFKRWHCSLYRTSSFQVNHLCDSRSNDYVVQFDWLLLPLPWFSP